MAKAFRTQNKTHTYIVSLNIAVNNNLQIGITVFNDSLHSLSLFAAEIESELNYQHCYSDRDNCFMDSRHPRKEHKIKTITKQYAIQ